MNTYTTLKSSSIFNFKHLFLKFNCQDNSYIVLNIYTMSENKKNINILDIDLHIENDKIVVDDFTFFLKCAKNSTLHIEDAFIDLFDKVEIKNLEELFSKLHKFSHNTIKYVPHPI